METQKSTQHSYQKLTNITNLLDDSEIQVCKYCNETGGEMVKLCQCNDFVHYRCLDKLHILHQTDKNKCEICQTQYYSNLTINYTYNCLKHICLVLLNIITMAGCTGYDLVNKYVTDIVTGNVTNNVTYHHLRLDYFVSIMFLIGIIYLFTLFASYISFMLIIKSVDQKYLQYFFIFHLIIQIIPVIICSIILESFFWNITTLAMSLTVLLAIIIPCLIIMIVVKIFKILRQSAKYREVRFSDDVYITI